MEIPRRVARFNRVVTNPIQGQWAWLTPPWAVICHRGRHSGRAYRTPVIAFRREQTLAVAVLYGEASDWVRNVLAGGGQVVRGGSTFELVGPRVVALEDVDVNAVSPAARAVGRVSGKLLVAGIGARVDGFGRGPGAA